MRKTAINMLKRWPVQVALLAVVFALEGCALFHGGGVVAGKGKPGTPYTGLSPQDWSLAIGMVMGVVMIGVGMVLVAYEVGHALLPWPGVILALSGAGTWLLMDTLSEWHLLIEITAGVVVAGLVAWVAYRNRSKFRAIENELWPPKPAT